MSAIDAIINEVVHQFADPNAFFRELVQNAIDAGSREIDISLSHDGTHARIVVEDFGEGMTREIVETKLTRLFASSKDNDFTKIGRFGIGFASVFAIAPELVVVDTARAGEQWRVLFFPDRTWELNVLDEPLEGTRITILKPMTVEAWEAFRVDAARVISFWCRFARVPVYLDGEDVRAPFEVDAPVTVRVEREDTVVVAGFVKAPDALNGYYNRGLTLMESASSRWPHMAFRIDSRYLEHTLTRDRVREDKHWARVVAILDEVYNDVLPQAFEAALVEAAQQGATPRWHTLVGLLSVAKRPEINWGRRFERLPIFVTDQGVRSAEQLAKEIRHDRVYLASDSHVAVPGPLYVQGDIDVTHEALKQLGQFVTRREIAWIRPIGVEPDAAMRALAAQFQLAHPHLQVVWCRLDYPNCIAAKAPAIWAPQVADEISASAWRKAYPQGFETMGWLALNAADLDVQHAIAIAASEPELAAYLLAKRLRAHTGIAIELDDVWLRHATQARHARVGGRP